MRGFARSCTTSPEKMALPTCTVLTFDSQSNFLESTLLQHMFCDVTIFDILEKSIKGRGVDDCRVHSKTQSLTHPCMHFKSDITYSVSTPLPSAAGTLRPSPRHPLPATRRRGTPCHLSVSHMQMAGVTVDEWGRRRAMDGED